MFPHNPDDKFYIKLINYIKWKLSIGWSRTIVYVAEDYTETKYVNKLGERFIVKEEFLHSIWLKPRIMEATFKDKEGNVFIFRYTI